MKSILIKPLKSEKTTILQTKSNNTKYTFVVELSANKIEIKQAVEAMYNVEVDDVQTLIMPPVVRRRYTRTGILEGKKPKYKKAVVTLAQPEELDHTQYS